MKKYLTLFQGIKFNIGLFTLLAVASVLGTLIPQTPENPERVQQFLANHPQWGAILQAAGFFNIYYSWWFIAMLALMAFDVIVCKLIFGKFPGFRTFRRAETEPGAVAAQPHKAGWTDPRDPEHAEAGLESLISNQGYAVQRRELPDGSVLLLGSKHRLQRFGSWVSHVSILIILLANLTGALYGFREVLNVVEGTSERMEHRPWTVTCDKFIVDWYPGTDTPKTFASELRLFTQGRLAREQQILVNEPMQHEKVRFYQATYGPFLKEARIGVFLRNNPKKSPTVMLRLDEEAAVPGTPYTLRILQFVPDFSLNENQEIVSRSVHAQNPALQVLISKNGKPLKAPWIFERFPTMQMPPVQADDEFILVLAEYVPSFYTGLQITYDPGADLFWIGCTILVAGLMLLFYFHHRKVWLWIKPAASGEADVQLGAYSSRGRSFEREFRELADALKAGARSKSLAS